MYTAVGAAAVAFLSCFLSWVDSPFVSVAGSQTEDGKIVMVIAALGALALFISSARMAFTIISGLLALASAGITVYHLVDIESGLTEELEGLVSTGAGLWIGFIASVVWLVAAVVSGLPAKQSPTAPAAG